VDEVGCPPDIFGDFDNDGDVDWVDRLEFEECATAPGVVQLIPDCGVADFDNDGCIDQKDFAVFQSCLSGLNQPADPSCDD